MMESCPPRGPSTLEGPLRPRDWEPQTPQKLMGFWMLSDGPALGPHHQSSPSETGVSFGDFSSP